MYVDWVRVYEGGNGNGGGGDDGGDITYVPGENSTAWASSETGGGYNEGPANVLDGNPYTKWASGTTQGLPQSITIDLGQTYNNVKQLKYFLSAYEWTARIEQYEVWVSTDNATYTKVDEGEWPNVPGVWYESNFSPVTARYVKLVALTAGQNESDASSRASATEIQIGYQA
nr:discoidin domain-containing protein [Cohnella zeiphila]